MTRTLLTGGRVFDGTGAPPGEADVLVEDGRILQVGPGLDGDEAVDVGGRHLLPGLFDCHTHVTLTNINLLGILQAPFSYRFFETVKNLAATLAAGITMVRDAAGADAGVKKAVADGLVPGPRLQISVTLLSQTGGHGDGWFPSGQVVEFWPPYPGMPDGLVDGPEAMRRKVRELIRAGADVIKVATSGGVLSPTDDPRHAHFRDDELTALVAEAAAAGRWVMAHAQASDGIKAAVRAGIRSIEHGIYLDDEAIELMLAGAPGWSRPWSRPAGCWPRPRPACPSRTRPGARRSRSPRPTPTRSGGPSPPGSRWPWGPTAASPRTAATWPSWS